MDYRPGLGQSSDHEVSLAIELGPISIILLYTLGQTSPHQVARGIELGPSERNILDFLCSMT